MSKVTDKVAAIAAFRQSARPTAASMRQWEMLDGDVGAGPQQVRRSLLGLFVHSIHVYSTTVAKLPIAVARAFQQHGMKSQKPIRRVAGHRRNHAHNVISNPCR